MFNKVNDFLNLWQRDAIIYNYEKNSTLNVKCRLVDYNKKDVSSYVFLDKRVHFSSFDIVDNNSLLSIGNSKYIISGIEDRFYADGSYAYSGFLTYANLFVDVYKYQETRDSFGNPVISKSVLFSDVPLSLRKGTSFILGSELNLYFEDIEFYTCSFFEVKNCLISLNGMEYEVKNTFDIFAGLQKFILRRSEV